LEKQDGTPIHATLDGLKNEMICQTKACAVIELNG
jgi:hypothetical protein